MTEYLGLQRELIRRTLIEDALEHHYSFVRLLYPELEGVDFIPAADAEVMCRAIDKVVSGKITRLIINVPPGYRKTMLFVIMLVARGLAISKRARFIHTSYSDKLVNDNSTKIREALACPTYKEEWNVKLRADVNTKGLWRTRAGGGLLASPSGGAITGFRAGTLEPGFTGALIIDDPLKPDDMFSKVERDKINDRWHTTFKSRLADEKVPVILIAQRLHLEDLSGYLLKGGSGEEWHHLMLPLVINNADEYPVEFTHGIPLNHKLPDGPLWERKHGLKEIEVLKLHPYTFQSQYMQRPIAGGGNLFKEEHFLSYTDIPDLMWRGIWADTAQKTQERHDYTVLQHWGRGFDGKAYLLDQCRGKYEADELLATAVTFWKKCGLMNGPKYGMLRSVDIEDKSSGTGLIQQLKRRAVPVRGIERGREDKYTRAMNVIPSFNAGLVMIPKEAHFLVDWKTEMLSFDGLGNSHDDQVDPTIDAVNEICVKGGGLTMQDVV